MIAETSASSAGDRMYAAVSWYSQTGRKQFCERRTMYVSSVFLTVSLYKLVFYAVCLSVCSFLLCWFL